MSSFSGTLKLLPPNGKMNGIILGINAQLLPNSSRVNVSFLTKNVTCCLQENQYYHNFYFDASDLNNGLVNISFEKLLPFYVYFVQLRYFTSIGFGPWSSIYQLLTKEGCKRLFFFFIEGFKYFFCLEMLNFYIFFFSI